MTTEGFPGAPGHTLRIRRAAGGAPDVRAPRGSQRSPANPVRQTGGPVRRPGPILDPAPPVPGQDAGVENACQQNTQRKLPRALKTSRSPP